MPAVTPMNLLRKKPERQDVKVDRQLMRAGVPTNSPQRKLVPQGERVVKLAMGVVDRRVKSLRAEPQKKVLTTANEAHRLLLN